MYIYFTDTKSNEIVLIDENDEKEIKKYRSNKRYKETFLYQ